MSVRDNPLSEPPADPAGGIAYNAKGWRGGSGTG